MSSEARPAIAELRFESEALGRKSRLVALLPHRGGPFPVLYLLHGFGGDCETWVRDYNLAGLLERRPFMVVLPEGGLGYYVNDPRPAGLGAWEDHVVQDVIGTVERLFPARRERAARVIAGNSMGGYGAFQLALRHPDLFAAAFSLSGSLYFAHEPHRTRDPFRMALAGGLPDGAYDVFRLSEALTARAAAERPALAFDCGREDPLLACNRAFHEHLDRLGWSHAYAEPPGRHDRAYWNTRLPELIRFAAASLQA